MDERKLGELFRAAVPAVPPPSFDHRDVVDESDRLRVRRRNALLGGSALAIVLLAGATVVGVALWRGTGAGVATNSASGAGVVVQSTGNEQPAPNEVPKEDAGRASDESLSAGSPKQGGTPTGNAGPPGPGSAPSGCEKADPELAAALAGELRAAPQTERPANLFCPPNSRGVAYRVSDTSGHSGLVSLVVSPKDAQFGSPTASKPEGTALRAGVARDGRHVVLISEPDPGSVDPPFEFDLQGLVDRLAAKV